MTSAKPLLQVGSNLFEIIEFSVTGVPGNGANLHNKKQTQNSNQESMVFDNRHAIYGVNVAKVCEVIRLPKIVPCLSSSPEVLGVFNLRGHPIPAIHLARALGYENEDIHPTNQVIVMEFSHRFAGFIVSAARRIRRVGWDRVLPPSSDAFNSITGMMLVENNEFIFILDFERILHEIEFRSAGGRPGGISSSSQTSHSFNGQNDILASSAGVFGAESSSRDKLRATVIIVDDSPTARRTVTEMLRGLNVNILEYQNGEACWNALTDGTLGNELKGKCIVISDVEMPRLDGYSLCLRIRKNPALQDLPVILHSSLSGEINKERAEKSGAAAYVSKFNQKAIVSSIEEHCLHKMPSQMLKSSA